MQIDKRILKKILRVALPLMMSGISMTLLIFVDRLFYLHYSVEAFAACVPAGLLSFSFLFFFNAMLSFTHVFMAFEKGANRPAGVNTFFWSSMQLAVCFGALLIILIPVGNVLLTFFARDLVVLALEKIYFSTLLAGAIFSTLNTVLIAYLTAVSQTRIIFKVALLVNIANIFLDYGLIYGRLGLPALGMFGGALSSVIANLISFIVYSLFIYHTNQTGCSYLARPIFSFTTIKKLLRKSLPRGIYSFVDLMGWVFFLNVIAYLPKADVLMNNILVTIERFCYMPMMVLAYANASMMSSLRGAKAPVSEIKATLFHVFFVAFLFFLFCLVCFNLFPSALVRSFYHGSQIPVSLQPLHTDTMVRVILPAFLCFNASSLILASVLEAYKDVHFKCKIVLIITVFLLIPISDIFARFLHARLITLWSFMIGILAGYTLIYYVRCRLYLVSKDV